MDPEIQNRGRIENQMARYRGDFNSQHYHPSHQLNEPYANPNDEVDILGTRSIKKYEGKDNKGYGIRLKKILGVGGYGIAALVEHTDRNNAVTQCVMKVELARHRLRKTTQKEEKALYKFKGAKHIVQILDLTDKIKAARNASPAKNTKELWVPDEELDQNWDIQKQRTRDFVLVEFAERGDLSAWLDKTSRSGRPWPNKALWWLFRCLVKGLVGMGYPPLEHHRRNDPWWHPNDPIEEYIPQGSRGPQETCHFDLDPLNVLVDSDQEHGDFPIFKINDFGGIEFYDQVATDPSYFNRAHFFSRRWRGKTWCFTPEQFTADWKSVGYYNNPHNEFIATNGSKPKVAGNYGMHSNVYQMWIAITRCKFSYKGTATVNGAETYGAALQDARFNSVDLQLRETVMMCLARDPSHRPTLAQLLGRIERALQRLAPESDAETQQWARGFFSTPQVSYDEPGEVQDAEMADGDGGDEPVLVGQGGGIKRECPPDDDNEDGHRYRSKRRIGESQNDVMPQALSGGDFLLSGDSQPAPQKLIFDALHNDQPDSPAQNAQPAGGLAPQNAQQQGQGGAYVPPHLRRLAQRQIQQQQQQHPPPPVLPTQKQQRRKQREQRREKQNGQRQPPAIYGQQQQQQQQGVQHPAFNVNAAPFQPQQQFMHNPQQQHVVYPNPNVFYQQPPQQQQQQFGYQNVVYQHIPPPQQQQQFVYHNVVYQHIPPPQQQQQFVYQNVVYQHIPPPQQQLQFGYTPRFPQQDHQPQPQ